MTVVSQARLLDFMASLVAPPKVSVDVSAAGKPAVVQPDPAPLLRPEASADGVNGKRAWSRASVEKLWAKDQLDPSAHRLRVGWGFVGGRLTVDGRERRVLAPLVSAAVKPRRFAVGARGALSTGFELVGDVVASNLIDDPADAEAVLEGLIFFDGAIPRSVDEDSWAAMAPLRKWLEMGAHAMGFEAEAVPPPTRLSTLRDGLSATVAPVGAFYLSDAADETSRSGALASWRDAVVDDPPTAFRSLYLPSGDPVPEPGEIDVAAVPLDRDQQRAVRNARTEPVSVIVGPPGTGKSHTVAATALDAVARGESVLLATRSQHAASVLIDFLSEAGGPTPIVFGDNQSRAELAGDLWDRVSADDASTDAVTAFDQAHRARSIRRRQATEALDAEAMLTDGDVVARILSTPDADVDLLAAEHQLATIDDPNAGWWARRGARRALDRLGGGDLAGLRRRVAVDRLKRDGGLALGPLVADHIAVEHSLRQRFGVMIRSRIADALERRERAAVLDLARALRAGRVKRREILGKIDADALLRAAPLWVGTMGDVEDLLPRRTGIFDLVIIDEASQVAQSTAPPALLRAKRLVAVGDANQLRHTSFLSDEAIGEHLRHAGLAETVVEPLLDLRRNSLLDAAASTGRTVELSTHYRSDPHLIDFSARRFYDGRVQPATRHPARDLVDCIDVCRVEGTRRNGTNEGEADEIIERIRRMLDERSGGTVGIVTPFRAQADLLSERVLAAFSAPDIESLQLAVGTVHAFQGAERDHMLVSLTIDDDSPGGSTAFIEDRNLFNVMVTRARSRMTVLTSRSEQGSGLIDAYLAHAEQVRPPPAERGAMGSWAARLETFLRDQDLTVRAGYVVGHEVIDLVVGDGDAAVALDCEVHPGGAIAHIERRSMLVAMGWTVVDAFESRWGERLA
ncbi:MAG: AAA domain-containing protein, partial [Actinomycetota bacterium]